MSDVNQEQEQFNWYIETLEKKSPHKLLLIKTVAENPKAKYKTISESINKNYHSFRKDIGELYREIEEALGFKKTINKPELIALCEKYKPEWFIDPDIFLNSKPSGQLVPEDPRYIKRDADEKLISLFSNSDQYVYPHFIRIKGAKGTGKSSILLNLEQILQNQTNHIFVSIDLESLYKESCKEKNLNYLLYQLTEIISRKFQQKVIELYIPDLKEYWKEDIAEGLSCTQYLNDYIFSQINETKTLILDGVDCVLEDEKIAKPFFDVLRSWNENHMKKRPIFWANIVIAYSTDPYAKHNVSNSPLNIGEEIQLSYFTKKEVNILINKYKITLKKSDIEQLMDLLGGQPALNNLILWKYKNSNYYNHQVDFQEVLYKAQEVDGIFDQYLRPFIEIVKNDISLFNCLEKIINNKECLNPSCLFKLRRTGLIKIDYLSQKYVVTCKLYQNYFNKYLYNNHDR